MKILRCNREKCQASAPTFSLSLNFYKANTINLLFFFFHKILKFSWLHVLLPLRFIMITLHPVYGVPRVDCQTELEPRPSTKQGQRVISVPRCALQHITIVGIFFIVRNLVKGSLKRDFQLSWINFSWAGPWVSLWDHLNFYKNLRIYLKVVSSIC